MSPIPRMRDARPSGRNSSSRSTRLAGAEELDRDARDRLHRERGAAARVAVELGEHEPVERRAARRRPCATVHRVAAHQRVADEQRVGGLGGARRSPRARASARRRSRAGRRCRRRSRRSPRARARSRRARRRSPAARSPSARRRARARRSARRALELLDRGGALDVGGDEQRAPPLASGAGARASRRRSSCRRPGGRRSMTDVTPRVARRAAASTGPHQRDELVVARLRRSAGRASRARRRPAASRTRVSTFSPSARSFTRSRKSLHDREVDVGLEQRRAHVAQRLGDVLLGELAHAAQPLARGAEALGERLEHGGGE